YFPFQTSNSVSSPRLSAPARNNSNVTEYSPGGAPSTGAAVLKRNRPSLPVTPFGVNIMSNFGWNVTFTPSAGLPLNSTVPDVGTVRGAEMAPPLHPTTAAQRRATSTTRLVCICTGHLAAVAALERHVGGHVDGLFDELHAPVAEQEVAAAGVRTAERIDRALEEDVVQAGCVHDGPTIVRAGERVHRHSGASLRVVVAAAGPPGDGAARPDRRGAD